MSLIKENSINKQGQKPDAMKLVATGIVNARFVILAAFVLISVYCALSIGKVKVNEDLTAFLPETTETRQGLTVMEDEFLTYGTADVMISNITVEIAQRLADKIRSFPHVTEVALDDSPVHFVDSSALLSISFPLARVLHGPPFL